MSYRTNRKTRGVFKVGSKTRESPSAGTIIRDSPEIVGFDYMKSVYVEDGSGSLYAVRRADGSTSEVEMSDALDTEAGDEGDEGMNEDHEYRNIRVVWDGAVDFEEGYDGLSDDSMNEVKRSLIKRYGKIAEDFLGTTEAQINEVIRGTQSTRESKGILDSDDAEDVLGGTKGAPSKDSGSLVGTGEQVFGDSGTGILGDD